jgi:hypothetical protein
MKIHGTCFSSCKELGKVLQNALPLTHKCQPLDVGYQFTSSCLPLCIKNSIADQVNEHFSLKTQKGDCSVEPSRLQVNMYYISLKQLHFANYRVQPTHWWLNTIQTEKRDIKHEIAEKQMKYCPSNTETKQSSHGAWADATSPPPYCI